MGFKDTYYYVRGKDAEDRFQRHLENLGYFVENIGEKRTPLDLYVHDKNNKFYVQMKFTHQGKLFIKESDIKYWERWEQETNCWVFLVVKYEGCYWQIDWKNGNFQDGFEWNFLYEIEEEPRQLPEDI